MLSIHNSKNVIDKQKSKPEEIKDLKEHNLKSTKKLADESIPAEAKALCVTSSSISAAELYYQNYILLLQKSGDNKFIDTASSQSDLYNACQLLCLAAFAKHPQALNKLSTEGGPLLTYGLVNTINLEFTRWLQEEVIREPSESNYLNLFILFYSKAYQNTYADYALRLNEITQALSYLRHYLIISKGKTTDFIKNFLYVLGFEPQELFVERNLSAISQQFLIAELSGLNPFTEALESVSPPESKTPQRHYPFRTVSKTQLKKTLNTLLTKHGDISKSKLDDIPAYVDKNIIKIFCLSNKSNYYRLAMPIDILKKAEKPICYIDKKSGIEVARFEMTSQRMHFKAYGDAIDLEIAGEVNIPTLIIENPHGEFTLTANLKSDQDIYVAARVAHLYFDGLIQSSQAVRLEASGEVSLSRYSELQSMTGLTIKAQDLNMEGEVSSKEICQMDIEGAITVSAQSKCHAENILLTARALKDIRGQLVADATLKIIVTDSIYLHGAASLSAPTLLAIKAKSFLTTDAARVRTAGIAVIELDETLIVDKESKLSGSFITVHAETFKNYSPHFQSKKAELHIKGEMINYPPGVITTEEFLQLKGGSVWNGGQLLFGKHLSVKLNKIFAHGLISSTDLLHLPSVARTSLIQGENISVVTGAFVN